MFIASADDGSCKQIAGLALYVDVVIVDALLGGTASILHQRQIPFFLFNASRAWLTHVFLSLDIDETEAAFSSNDNILPCFNRRSCGVKYVDPFLEAMKSILLEHRTTIPLAKGIIINSMRDVEEEYLKDIVKSFPFMRDVKVYCAGPLMPLKGAPTDPNEVSTDGIVNQMRKQAPSHCFPDRVLFFWHSDKKIYKYFLKSIIPFSS